METVKKILAPTDLSELSCIGLGHAMETARAQGAGIIVYYVIDINDQLIAHREELSPVSEILERHKRLLDRLLRQKFAEQIDRVDVHQLVELGKPHTNIVEKAKQEKVDMIIMSTHGRSALDHLLIGSVAEKVVARAPCPVLVIPAPPRKRATKAA